MTRFLSALSVVLVLVWSIFWYGHFAGRKAGLLNNMVEQRASLAFLGPESQSLPELTQCLGRIQAARESISMSLALNEYITDSGALDFALAPFSEPYHYLGAGQVASLEKLRRRMCPFGEVMMCSCEIEDKSP